MITVPYDFEKTMSRPLESEIANATIVRLKFYFGVTRISKRNFDKAVKNVKNFIRLFNTVFIMLFLLHKYLFDCFSAIYCEGECDATPVASHLVGPSSYHSSRVG